MSFEQDIDFTGFRPLRDMVLVSRPTAEDDVTALPSGLYLPGHGQAKNRLTVLAAGPDCKTVRPGMVVLIPAVRDIQNRRAIVGVVQSEAEYLIYQECDLITGVDHLTIPAEWLEPPQPLAESA